MCLSLNEAMKKSMKENGLICTCNACDRIIREGETFNNASTSLPVVRDINEWKRIRVNLRVNP